LLSVGVLGSVELWQAMATMLAFLAVSQLPSVTCKLRRTWFGSNIV